MAMMTPDEGGLIVHHQPERTGLNLQSKISRDNVGAGRLL